MAQHGRYGEAADRFAVIARKYCDIVDSAKQLEKSELLARVYDVLPSLIDGAIHLPDVDVVDDDTEREMDGSPSGSRINQDARQALHNAISKKLGDSDTYQMVFNAIKDKEAIHGSLADDIADIYRDLKEGLVNIDRDPTCAQDVIWEWKLGFTSHWGHHAIDALKAIHDFRYY